VLFHGNIWNSWFIKSMKKELIHNKRWYLEWLEMLCFLINLLSTLSWRDIRSGDWLKSSCFSLLFLWNITPSFGSRLKLFVCLWMLWGLYLCSIKLTCITIGSITTLKISSFKFIEQWAHSISFMKKTVLFMYQRKKLKCWLKEFYFSQIKLTGRGWWWN